MIDEEATFRKYGYRSTDSRCRRVVAVCDGCGEPRDSSKYVVAPLCRKCVMKDREWTDERRKEWSDARKGENNPNFGNTGGKNPWHGGKASTETRERMSYSHAGKKNHMFGKHHSEETCTILSEKNTGENNPNYGMYGEDASNWQGGLTEQMQAIRNSPAYKNWRAAVYLRDNWTCMECGGRSSSGNAVELNAHHIHPIKDNKNTLSIFDINNGVTLCAGCHNATKGCEDSFIEHYTEMLHS